MNAPQAPAAPASGPTDAFDDIPSFEELIADPEIAALLDFEPVPRQRQMENGWTPELQRLFVARLAVHGSATKASDEMGKNQTGVMKLYRSPLGKSFRAAWDGAVALAKRRRAERDAELEPVSPGLMPPTLDHRRKHPAAERSAADDGGLPGQVLNEHGEYEDEASLAARAEEAKDSIGGKLVRIRRLYLQEISACPGKRAAFEILTELPVDWDKAEAGEPQEFDPWLGTNQRQPVMILTAESGWSFGEIGYGPDKKANLRNAIDKHREEAGLPPVNWED